MFFKSIRHSNNALCGNLTMDVEVSTQCDVTLRGNKSNTPFISTTLYTGQNNRIKLANKTHQNWNNMFHNLVADKVKFSGQFRYGVKSGVTQGTSWTDGTTSWATNSLLMYAHIDDLDISMLDIRYVYQTNGWLYSFVGGGNVKLDMSRWITKRFGTGYDHKNYSGDMCSASGISYIDMSGWDLTNVQNNSNFYSYLWGYNWYGAGYFPQNGSYILDMSNQIGCRNYRCLNPSKATKIIARNIDMSRLANDYRATEQMFTSPATEIDLTGTTLGCTAYKMFYNCSRLANLIISNFDVSACENFQSMFQGCSALTDISSLANWDVSNGTDFSSMFNECTTLTNISPLANWDIKNNAKINSMLRGTRISDLTPLANWDVSHISAFGGLFGENPNIVDISPLANWDTSGVTGNICCFYKCTNLIDISPLANWDVSNCTAINECFQNTKVADLTPLTNWNVGNVQNFSYSFYGTKITTLTPIANWDVSSGTNFSYMFSGCSSLASANLSNWDVSSGTNFSYMFNGCTSLTTLNLNGWDMTNATITTDMFKNCNALTTIYAVGCNATTITKLTAVKPAQATIVTTI